MAHITIKYYRFRTFPRKVLVSF